VSAVDPLTYVEPAATRVRDPISGRSVWLADIIRGAKIDGDVLKLDLVFGPKHGETERAGIQQALAANIKAQGFAGRVEAKIAEAPKFTPAAHAPKKDPVPGMTGPGVAPHGGPIHKQPIEGVKFVVAVSSAKGGVGKSTVAVNLAVALAREGRAVGLLDADIYGPSTPRMMNANLQPLVDDKQRILPPSSYGVKVLSAGMLVPENEAIIWRGPMVMSLVRQFLQQAKWGELDYLVVDLPPGTGDAQLTLIQACDIAGAVIVTTPQDVALADAVRGITMFRKLEVPLLGLVENMAWYELPDGTKDYVFGDGGGVRLAQRENTEVLGQIPLQTAIRKGGDQGLPAALADDSIGLAFRHLARKVIEKLPTGAR